MSAKRGPIIKSNRIVTGLVTILVISALLAGCRGGGTTSDTTTTESSEPVNGTIYNLSYRYNEGKFSLKEVHVESGSAPYRREPPEAGYKYEVVSLKGKVLGSFGFVLPLLHYDYPNPQSGQLEGGIIEQKVMDGTIRIPYFTNGGTINLYDPNGTRVLSVNVRNLAIKLTLHADVWTDKGGKGYGVPNGVYSIGEPIFIYMSVDEDCTVGYWLYKPDNWIGDPLDYGNTRWSAGIHSLREIPGTTFRTAVGPPGTWKIMFEARTDKESVVASCQFEVITPSEPANPVTTSPQEELSHIVGSIIANPRAFEGYLLTVVGYYRGWDLLHEANGGPPTTKSDWVVKDASGAIYVGLRPAEGRSGGGVNPRLNPSSREDMDTIVKITGIIRVTHEGQPYIEPQSVEILP